jgi:hypothetical protein
LLTVCFSNIAEPFPTNNHAPAKKNALAGKVHDDFVGCLVAANAREITQRSKAFTRLLRDRFHVH